MATKPKKSMKECTPKAKAKNFAYPEKTSGSEIAARVRKDANNLSETDREELFRQGMQIIYGGPTNTEKVRSR